jgi:uncharacterized protein with HEPN domain
MKDTHRLLQDMLDAIASIETYAVTSYDAFLQDEKTQDAIMFNLIIMGEAANSIPHEFQEKHPEIPWPSIIGTRNVIVHGYDQVKLQIVWDIIQKNLNPLKTELLSLI